MRYAISLKPSTAGLVALAQRVEAAGFESLWLYDVPLLWPDPVPHLAVVASATERLRLGLCVTNPATRPPRQMALQAATLQALSGGRLELGIGRGDGAVRKLGVPPATLDEVREAIGTVRDFHADSGPPRIWMGTYGPRGLRLAGELADGVILQFADPWLVRWALRHLRAGAEAVGRDPGTVRVMAASTWGGSPADVRWFCRMVAGDIARLMRREPSPDPDLAAWSAAWLESGGTDALADAVADRLCLLGDPRARLEALEAAGVEVFNLFVLDDLSVVDRFLSRQRAAGGASEPV